MKICERNSVALKHYFIHFFKINQKKPNLMLLPGGGAFSSLNFDILRKNQI